MNFFVYQDDGWTGGISWFDKARYETEMDAQDDRGRQIEASRKSGCTRYRIVERVNEQTVLLEDCL